MASAYKTEFARNLVDILYIKKLMGKRENKNKTKNIFSDKGKRKKKPSLCSQQWLGHTDSSL